jgi:hypothetical protein
MLEILDKRCDQCLFSKSRIVSKERVRGVLRDCKDNDSYFICHKTKGAMCRGYHETQPPSQMERIAGRLGMIKYVALEDTN